MRVLKFGGTSLANANQFIHVANILEKNSQEEQIAAVLSAPAMVTNHLIAAIDLILKGNDVLESICNIEFIFNTLLENITQSQLKFDHVILRNILKKEFVHLKRLLYGISLLKYCPDNINANIICLGEKLSIILMEGLLTARNLKTIIIDPVNKIAAKGGYLVSTVDIEESMRRIRAISIAHINIILMAGFIAGNERGELVALGRNGSDYSAAILAACLGANRCEIWTDVDGIYTCDPRKVPDAKLLCSLSYQEAMELSYFGAKILHPRTIAPIAQFHIPCLIKNVFKPTALGTLIGVNVGDKSNVVKGITYLNDMVMFNISGPGMKGMIGMAARVFSAMSRAVCSVVLITQSSSEYSISFCIPSRELSNACTILNEEFNLELKNGLLEPIDIIHDLAIVSVVGDGMRTQLGLSSKLFGALAIANINIVAIAQGSSERSISVVVKNKVATIGMQAIHRVLFSTNRLIEVFIIGVGGVGTALIEQIKRQCYWLKKNKDIDLKVCGVANSRIMFIDIKNGVNLNTWKKLLKQSKTPCNLKQLLAVIKTGYLENPVVVDCTSSVEVASCYIDFLSNGCHVITPNKQANTGSMKYYRTIRDVAILSKKKFLYDTNVGAGLPVIDNLQHLLNAGDELISFSGILSGSLSFIFGKLDEGLSLSTATLLAQKKGYTEPDPKEDLSGIDIARKLLVLAREVGYELELSDIYIDPLLLGGITSNNISGDFFKTLSALDNAIFIKTEEARASGRVLRCVGNIQQGRCFVRIESIDNNHPLFKIKDGENALAFITRYYQPLPLVLRGYGAGNDVTAAGVFADVLRTLS